MARRLAAPPKSAPAASVTVAPVEQKEIVEWTEFTGRTEPVESVEIRPRTSGYIQEVHFQSGQLVKKGDVLRAIQGDILEMPLLAEARCPEEIKRAWRRIKIAAEGEANTITFEEICADANGRSAMYYI